MSRLWIGLGGLRIANYPERGARTIIFDFYGRNQTARSSEDLHFHGKYDVAENDSVGVLNLPLFVDLNAGDVGVHSSVLL